MSATLPYERLLITGAAGYLGGVLRRAMRDKGQRPRLTDIKAPSYPLESGEDFVTVDLARLDQVQAVVKDIDAIVHLGGNSLEAPWEIILNSNIVGTYTVFEAARLAGVKRIVFASSHHAVGYYRRDRTIDTNVPPRPDSRYALSKVFGEAVGRLYADKHGMSVICQRIGIARPKPPHQRALRAWLSEDDFVRLTFDCLRARDVHFEIVYGVSANDGSFWDNDGGRHIGYAPRDSARAFEKEILAQAAPEDAIEALFQGGKFTSVDFDGDPSKID
ncbi:NAD-dependent epimerase/dehydratase family protein [Bradyrhizobium brasilense]|uniref:NAD-dependent epimerase/dehydratase family protein n=1 Tax=Bradyrhizobium brasilense TaxID=1419277 RepID=UPI001E3D611B|nr:NAD(P)-dependent oxidoreductase [Bradyrhizobium brasilense]MCC8973561.1 NAD(P)-dependent oxidoreductase [Bradyrhizobium brasilense]